MGKNVLINHRCKQSVAARASIRYEIDKYSPWKPPKWVQYHHDCDYDYGWEGQSKVGEISYCPYCGIELKTLPAGS